MHRRRLRGLRWIAEFRHRMEVCAGQTDRSRMGHEEEHCKEHHCQLTTRGGHSNNNYFFCVEPDPETLLLFLPSLPRTPPVF